MNPDEQCLFEKDEMNDSLTVELAQGECVKISTSSTTMSRFQSSQHWMSH